MEKLIPIQFLMYNAICFFWDKNLKISRDERQLNKRLDFPRKYFCLSVWLVLLS